MKTVRYTNFEIQVTDDNKVVGYQDLGRMYPTASSYEAFQEKINEIAAEKGIEHGPSYRFFSINGVEGWCNPALEVFWIEDFR